jgi:hypothetical protein
MGPVSLWSTAEGRKRFFLIPDDHVLAKGDLVIQTSIHKGRSVAHDSVVGFEITEEQARRWATDQLGSSLDELRTGIDETLDDLRQQLDGLNRVPVSDDTAVTREAPAVLLSLLKQLPRVVGQSISGDDSRVDAARNTMADLQGRLREVGIDLDDRFKDFPDRLADLRRKQE